MSEQSTNEIFVKDYIDAWSTEDDATREKLVAKVYVDDATFYANEPGDDPVDYHGLADIAANIKRVNVRLVQAKGLITESTDFSVNHNILKVAWRMLTPDGKVALSGMNVLLRDDLGKILKDYIFVGYRH
jgi:hypothetical protein